jgi:crotonobetainyl-CoA:carnitine CoA-transferase CaiB-like acyl-CoA transferase
LAGSVAFAALNRGKSSLTLDLKAKGDRERLAPLLARADVLIEQFRPGVMDRLDLGYERIRAINPRIVYCSISGYGQSGPRAQEAGHDLNYIGATGLLALNPGPHDRPTVPPALVADIGGGTFPAVLNILLGLRQRDMSGQGCHIDIAMSDAMFTFAWHALLSGFAGHGFPGSGEDHLVGGSPRYRLYPTRDGKVVACAALEPKFWNASPRRSVSIPSTSTTPKTRTRPPRPSRPSSKKGAPTNGDRLCRCRLLRHHRGVVGGRGARSTFRRPRTV